MKRDKLRRMSTAQLDALLQKELRRDVPDEEVVMSILEILEKKDQKPDRKQGWIISAAAVAVLVLLIAIVPTSVGADNLYEAVIHISNSILQFFAPGTQLESAQTEYTFQTDNPGLQQLYDNVVALGITDPVVPMWLPEGYKVVEIKHAQHESWEKITAIYQNAENYVIITYKICDNIISSTQYEQCSEHAHVYESGEIAHALTKNGKNWTAIWIKQGVECMITVTLEKEELQKVIDSIYRRN